MASPITRSRRSTPASIEGLTLIELLIAIVVAAILLTAVIGLTLSSNRLFGADRARTELNQNLRSALDIVGNDIRVAGERLNSFTGAGTVQHPLAAVEVAVGTQLYLRRNLLDEILPLCQGVLPQTETTIQVARTSEGDGVTVGNRPECFLDTTTDGNNNGVPDALEVWRDYRAENGPEVGAFIYANAKFDFFLYSADPSNLTMGRIAGSLDNEYLVGERPALIMVEERWYRLNDGVLELIINGDWENPLRLINRVTDFQVRAVTRDGTLHTNFVGRGSNWSQLASVELSVTALVQEGGRQVERTYTSRYFPRNVLSN